MNKYYYVINNSVNAIDGLIKFEREYSKNYYFGLLIKPIDNKYASYISMQMIYPYNKSTELNYNLVKLLIK